MSDFIEIGGLWKKKNKDGGTFLNGRLSQKLDLNLVTSLVAKAGTSVFVFPNKYKNEGDNKPDYKLYLAPPKEQAKLVVPATGFDDDQSVPF